ncbi:MAG: hypothetical protein WA941_00320 [Nitrososphaeraceae archaeon]
MHDADYLRMFRVLITFTIIIITLTVNPYLIPQVISSSESSSLSSEDSDDSGSQNESPQDDSETDDNSNGGSNDNDDNNNDNGGIGQTDDQELTSDDDDEIDKEPPTSTERGGNPLEGLNVGKELGKEECEKYLKSLGGGDDTNIGDTIENPFKTKEEICKGILGGEGIDVRNTTTTVTSELTNQTDLIDNSNSTEGELVITEEGTPSPCIVISEEGTPSGPGRPQPQPSPSPKPC